MKILFSSQIRKLDQYTIENEPIESIDLMERASLAFCHWFMSKFRKDQTILIYAGTGNNGGDGLAIGRILRREGYPVEIVIVGNPENGTEDFRFNLAKLPIELIYYPVDDLTKIPPIIEKDIIVDALFGSGLNRPVEGLHKEVIGIINQSKSVKVSVDVPSGLYCDGINSISDIVVKADYTLTFQLPKLCFLLPENERFVGEWSVVDIGLSQQFISDEKSDYEFILKDFIKERIKKRSKFSHKGTFGHALLIAGSYGKIGAATLAAKSCLRTGVGLLTIQIPKCGYEIIQISVPEAMCLVDANQKEVSELNETGGYKSIGIGPGIGKSDNAKHLLEQLLKSYQKPTVLDADALNIISEKRELLNYLPENSILTPHPKEFERLAGKSENSIQRLEILKEFCQKNKCIVVLKGAYTATCSTIGQIYFNSTGNPGMATGGSGDVLTGIITSLLAQNYQPLEAAILGVYLHGYAGDVASQKLGYESILASDIAENIPFFFKEFLPLP